MIQYTVSPPLIRCDRCNRALLENEDLNIIVTAEVGFDPSEHVFCAKCYNDILGVMFW